MLVQTLLQLALDASSMSPLYIAPCTFYRSHAPISLILDVDRFFYMQKLF